MADDIDGMRETNVDTKNLAESQGHQSGEPVQYPEQSSGRMEDTVRDNEKEDIADEPVTDTENQDIQTAYLQQQYEEETEVEIQGVEEETEADVGGDSGFVYLEEVETNKPVSFGDEGLMGAEIGEGGEKDEMLEEGQESQEEHVEIMEDITEEGEARELEGEGAVEAVEDITEEGEAREIEGEGAVEGEEFKPEVEADATEREVQILNEEEAVEGKTYSEGDEALPEEDFGAESTGEEVVVETEEDESGLEAGTEAEEAKPEMEKEAEGEEVRPKGEEAETEEVRPKGEEAEGEILDSEEAEDDKTKAEVETKLEEETEAEEAKPEGEEAEEAKPEGEEAEEAKPEGEEAEGDIPKPEEEEAEKEEGAAENVAAKPVDDTVTRVGDFTVVKRASFEDIALQPEIQLGYTDDEEEEEEEEEEEAEVEEEEEIDRNELIERFKILQNEGRPIVQKNVFLLKKLAEYFKKRKMEHVYKHPEHYSADKEFRYHKQLLAFDDIRRTEASERETITRELEELKLKKNAIVGTLKEEVDFLIQKERSIGIGLINTRTGKVIPDRLVNHLLSRQMRKIKEVSEVRLAFIKLHERVTAKNAQLKALETFGSNLHLVDYEQLRMQNQSLTDKIEERDEELQRLRLKATSAIQCMAHMREKSHATDEKLDELCELIDYAATEANNTRGYIRDMKRRRDWLRAETLRLRQDSGLLVHPPLLRHFEKSIDEATLLSTQVQNLKNAFHDQKRNLTEIRKCIDASGGRGSTTFKTAKNRSLPPLAEQKRKSVSYNLLTSAHRRKSMKVTPSLLLSTADQMRRRASRASRSMSVSLALQITQDRPSFFPSHAKESYYKKSAFPNFDT